MSTQRAFMILLKLIDFLFLAVAASSRGTQGVWMFNGFGYAAHLGNKKKEDQDVLDSETKEGSQLY